MTGHKTLAISRALPVVALLILLVMIVPLAFGMITGNMGPILACAQVIYVLVDVCLLWGLWLFFRTGAYRILWSVRYLAPPLVLVMAGVFLVFDLVVLPLLVYHILRFTSSHAAYLCLVQIGLLAALELVWIFRRTQAYSVLLAVRYLIRKPLAYWALIAVTQCVALMLVVVSVMGGFLDKIEDAAKGLFGDIVVDAGTQHGLALYDEFIAHVRQEVPEVTAGSPFILSYGIIRVKTDPNYRQAVQIAGIRLPERVDVSDFENGLFIQAGVDRPTFDPDVDLMAQRLGHEHERMKALFDRETESAKDGSSSLSKQELLRLLYDAGYRAGMFAEKAPVLKRVQQQMRTMYAQLQKLRAAGEAKAAEADELENEITEFGKEAYYRSPEYRVILGLGIQGLTVRTKQGETVRLLQPGDEIVLYVFPLGRIAKSDLSPNIKPFTVVDDCKTDVSNIDAEFVYIPFATLQKLNNMDSPKRCSQIHFKVREGLRGERDLQKISDRIQELWYRFKDSSPVWKKFVAEHPDMAEMKMVVQTWRRRQARVIAPIQSQRTLVVTMFGFISVVALFLIFVIFHMIVVQKTKDIGVLKSFGATGSGVAGIFIGYGVAVGLIGAIAGVILGYHFVVNINPIHDWIGEKLGLVIWSREWFLFEKIPNHVNPWYAVVIMLASIAAGIIGALIPAVEAARKQPVEALRYE